MENGVTMRPEFRARIGVMHVDYDVRRIQQDDQMLASRTRSTDPGPFEVLSLAHDGRRL